MNKPVTQPRERAPEPRPTASATIEPVGSRDHDTRAHAVRLHLPLSSFDAQLADRRSVLDLGQVALRALEGGEAVTYFDVVARDKVVGVEALLTCEGTPSAEAIGRMRQALSAAGYHVVVRLLRECADVGCTTTTTTDPSRTDGVPSGWHSAVVCGKHGYRECASCGSLYVMMSATASGPAAAVHCEVCGTVLVEWGGSKHWTAELVTRGRTP